VDRAAPRVGIGRGAGMRILVTGHTGYIGTVLMPMLAARGHRITGCDTDIFLRCSFGNAPKLYSNFALDVRDLRSIHLAGFDAVIHLAGLSNDPLGDLDPKLTIAINAQASFQLAVMARRAGVGRFVFSSSCSNYGAGGQELLDETSAQRPVTPYGHSKVLAEEWIGALADHSFSPVFLRNATVYGLSPRLRFDLVVNNLAAHAFADGRIFLKSDGTAWRPLVHVEDVCRAFVAAVEAPRDAVHGEVFNVGRTEENYRVRDVARIVGEECPGATIKFADGADADARNYRVDCSKFAQRFPDVSFTWDVRAGVRQLLAAYAENRVTSADFEGARYQRIAHVRMLMKRGVLDSDLRVVRSRTFAEAATV
jgi:nucleoside-diphosphate-sugar epimerase